MTLASCQRHFHELSKKTNRSPTRNLRFHSQPACPLRWGWNSGRRLRGQLRYCDHRDSARRCLWCACCKHRLSQTKWFEGGWIRGCLISCTNLIWRECQNGVIGCDTRVRSIYLFSCRVACVARLLACLNVSCILLSWACWEFMIAASRWHPYFTSRQVHQCVRLASEDNIFITPPPHGCIMMQSKLTPRFFNVPTSSHFLRSFKWVTSEPRCPHAMCSHSKVWGHFGRNDSAEGQTVRVPSINFGGRGGTGPKSIGWNEDLGRFLLHQRALKSIKNLPLESTGHAVHKGTALGRWQGATWVME